MSAKPIVVSSASLQVGSRHLCAESDRQLSQDRML
jgi:hypothetical protein